MNRSSVLVIGIIAYSASLFADPQFVRWTYKEDKDASFAHVLKVVNEKTGLSLTEADFIEIEKRPLANNHFTMYYQVAAGLPISRQNIRVWTGFKSGNAIQVEARVDVPPSPSSRSTWSRTRRLDSAQTLKLVKQAITAQAEDTQLRGVTWQDEWQGQEVFRVVKAKAKLGTHVVTISFATRTVVDQRYEEYPRFDLTPEVETGEQGAEEFELPAMVYPVWEEYEGAASLANRVPRPLKYLSRNTRRGDKSTYDALKSQHYLETKFDPIKGLTEEGRKQGFWAMGYIKELALGLYEKLPLEANEFSSGAVLEGRYTTISLHPSAGAVEGLDFTPATSSQFLPSWAPSVANPDEYEMTPGSGLLGRPVKSVGEVLARPATRDPKHNIVKYLNDGFDEVQVYWAVTQMFDSLRPMGFVDPELSTRKFHAYLYDTDISMRDNAYYTDDTINFTTYSPTQPNYARDNTTIWHELGHGVMDRLMGDHIRLADTGGLSEGMADFVAQMVLNHVTQGKGFEGKDKLRIFNHTGFNLTNEVHDDGEAYGGAMNDILVTAMAKEGLVGLHKVTDLTLEAMRLSRNHPGLTANDWFNHMLFADELGHSPVRRPGELGPLVLKALAGRNFNLDGSPVATYRLLNGEEEVTATGLGSRPRPIPLKLKKEETQAFHLKVNLKGTDGYQFKYPVTVKIGLRGGPLQGAIHWTTESDTAQEVKLEKESDTATFDLAATGVCDEVNRPDGSCVDFAYIQIWNQGETSKPAAKKRFYLRVFPQPE